MTEPYEIPKPPLIYMYESNSGVVQGVLEFSVLKVLEGLEPFCRSTA